MSNHDEYLFADEDQTINSESPREGWKILLVDDEPAVHDVTLLALNDFEYNERPLTFLHAYSAQEAKKILRQHDDVAVALIDVVMETDDAGLQLVKWIRQELGNSLLRLILRTGQPGQAPENKVVVELDINDYKEKAELTFGKLFTLIVTSIRSYLSLNALEKSRNGLVQIIESSRGLATRGSIEKFVQGVLLQLQAVFAVEETAFYCGNSEGNSDHPGVFQEFLVASGIGAYSGTHKIKLRDIQDSALDHGIRQTLQAESTQVINDCCYLYFRSEAGNQCVLFISRLNEPLDDTERGLLDSFCANVNYAFDNLALHRIIDGSA